MSTTASMSSVHNAATSADKCIDGNEDGNGDYCMTLAETAPWLALDYGSEVKVSSVVLINRISCTAAGCEDRTRNVNIQVSSTLPVSGSEMFTGGQLLGTFEGPGTPGQMIGFTSETELTGRYVVVQTNFSSAAERLNLQEVTAWAKGKIFVD